MGDGYWETLNIFTLMQDNISIIDQTIMIISILVILCLIILIASILYILTKEGKIGCKHINTKILWIDHQGRYIKYSCKECRKIFYGEKNK